MLKILTDKNFMEEVEKAKELVFVDFWSTFCGSCKVQMPIVEELAEENTDGIKFGKFEVGENPDIPAKYGIMSIPALAIFKNGKISSMKNGLQSKNSLKGMIDEALKA